MSIDKKKSVEIYSILNTGRIINRHKLNNSGVLMPNDLFNEIMDNLVEYRALYENIGFTLVDNTDYFYLNDININEANTKESLAVKIQILLTVIGKYINDEGYLISKIHPESTGLSKEDFEKMVNVPHLKEIFYRLQLNINEPSDIRAYVKKTLVDRGVMMEKPTTGNFVLSDSGMSFFQNAQNYLTKNQKNPE